MGVLILLFLFSVLYIYFKRSHWKVSFVVEHCTVVGVVNKVINLLYFVCFEAGLELNRILDDLGLCLKLFSLIINNYKITDLFALADITADEAIGVI